MGSACKVTCSLLCYAFPKTGKKTQQLEDNDKMHQNLRKASPSFETRILKQKPPNKQTLTQKYSFSIANLAYNLQIAGSCLKLFHIETVDTKSTAFIICKVPFASLLHPYFPYYAPGNFKLMFLAFQKRRILRKQCLS